MKIKKSKLELLDFVVLESECKFILPEDVEQYATIADSYTIDVDFTKFGVNGAPNITRMFMKIEVNKEEPIKTGISLIVEGMALFKIIDASDEEKNELLNRSGISMIMNSLRGFISNMTSYTPFGRYVLPSIDVTDLLNQKFGSSHPTITK